MSILNICWVNHRLFHFVLVYCLNVLEQYQCDEHKGFCFVLGKMCVEMSWIPDSVIIFSLLVPRKHFQSNLILILSVETYTATLQMLSAPIYFPRCTFLLFMVTLHMWIYLCLSCFIGFSQIRLFMYKFRFNINWLRDLKIKLFLLQTNCKQSIRILVFASFFHSKIYSELILFESICF